MIRNNGLHDRVEREREAHTERDVLAENARIKSRFPHLESYPSMARFDAIIEGIAATSFPSRPYRPRSIHTR